MSVKFAAPLALIALVSCSGNPFNPTPPAPSPVPEPIPSVPPPEDIGEPITGPITVEVPAIVAQHVRSAAYNQAAGTLTIDLASLDGTPVRADYTRENTLDLSGYEAFRIQETASQRKFIALVKSSDSGNATATVVADGGQFGTYFGGANYYRVDAFTLPASGLATYIGSYVGLLNGGEVVPGGAGGAFNAAQSDRTTGRIMLNADFNETNLAVNGGIDGRQNVRTGEDLMDVFLWPAQIGADGAFAGRVHDPDDRAVGNFSGLFAGTEASDVAGALVFRPISGNSTVIEHGVFVLPKCSGAVATGASTCP